MSVHIQGQASTSIANDKMHWSVWYAIAVLAHALPLKCWTSPLVAVVMPMQRNIHSVLIQQLLKRFSEIFSDWLVPIRSIIACRVDVERSVTSKDHPGSAAAVNGRERFLDGVMLP